LAIHRNRQDCRVQKRQNLTKNSKNEERKNRRERTEQRRKKKKKKKIRRRRFFRKKKKKKKGRKRRSEYGKTTEKPFQLRNRLETRKPRIPSSSSSWGALAR